MCEIIRGEVKAKSDLRGTIESCVIHERIVRKNHGSYHGSGDSTTIFDVE